MRYIFALFFICNVFSIYPVYYKGRIYCRYNKDVKQKQYVISLSDVHAQSKALNLPQINEMARLMSSLKNLLDKDKIMFIAEDMVSHDKQGLSDVLDRLTLRRDSYFLKDEDLSDLFGVLPSNGLVNFARAGDIAAENVEYRFVRGIALPITIEILIGKDEENEIFNDALFSTQMISQETSDYLEKHEKNAFLRQEMFQKSDANTQKKHDLTVVDNRWNKFKEKYLDKCKNNNELLKSYNGSFIKFLKEKIDQEKWSTFVGNYMILDEDLMTVDVLHHIALASKKKKIIVAMGGYHIRDLDEPLKEMGFEIIDEEGEEGSSDDHWKENKELAVTTKKHIDFTYSMIHAQTADDLKKAFGCDITFLDENFFKTIFFLDETFDGEATEKADQ